MTITPWTIYLITLLGDVRDAAKLLTVVGRLKDYRSIRIQMMKEKEE